LYLRLAAALFLILIVLVSATFQDYGISWDEGFQHEYGERILRFYTSLFKDRSSLVPGDLANYGGAFEVPAVLATRTLPFDLYETRHLLTALTGIAGIFACWRIVRLLAGPAAAFWAVLLLSLYPSYYGHMFINSKDIPFAALCAWSSYYLIRILRELPEVSFKTAAKLGVAIGLAMGTRVGGLLLLCYVYAALAVYLAHFGLAKASSTGALFKRTAAAAALVTTIAYGVMLLAWPYALGKPFLRPFTTLQWLSRIQATRAARTYVPEHLAVKLPELVLVLLGVSIVIAIREIVARRLDKDFSKTLSYGVLATASLFPVVYAIITQPFLYDEVRHFLFVIPPMFCIAGIVLNRLIQGSKSVLFVVALYLLFHLSVLVRLHPYEYAYFNQLPGGLQGAFKRNYVTEYWATSYKEGVEQLRTYLQTRDGTDFERTTYRILVGPAEWCASRYFPPNFTRVTEPAQADIYLSTTRNGYDTEHAGREVVSAGRLGVPFVVAKILD
jgi:hypothetical protein